MNRVGILYICTGKYACFWKDFYRSCETYFLPDAEKHYFIWTDNQEIIELGNNNDYIHIYYKEVEKWPLPTLRRYHYFLEAEHELVEMHYVIFMNGNLLVQNKVLCGDILPRIGEHLFATIHPGFFASSPNEYTYDINPESSAYIKKGDGNYYFAGGFNGGKSEDFVEMAKAIDERTEKDYKNNIIARWHDESQLNRYLFDYKKNIRILSPSYLYPEEMNIPFEKKIIIRDKKKYGGHNIMRSVDSVNNAQSSIHIIRFMGGFANQLFQYAFYCKLKEVYGSNVFADLAHYEIKQDHGGFKLDEFFKISKIYDLPYEMIQVNEKNYSEIQILAEKVYYYNGYWQSSNYFPTDTTFFEVIKESVNGEQRVKDVLAEIDSSNSVSVHVRRGDYVNNPVHSNIATRAYYQNAISYIESKLENVTFYIFSDDIEWCKENLNFDRTRVRYVTGNENCVHYDLVMMSRCKHNIIANSSFSWWAKTLNANPNKIVIAPPRWFNERINVEPLDTSDAIIISNVPYLGQSTNINKIIIITITDEYYLERCLVSILSNAESNCKIIISGKSINQDNSEYIERVMKDSGIQIELLLGIFWKIKQRNFVHRSDGLSITYLNSDEFVKE